MGRGRRIVRPLVTLVALLSAPACDDVGSSDDGGGDAAGVGHAVSGAGQAPITVYWPYSKDKNGNSDEQC
jgi:hypothetical protein